MSLTIEKDSCESELHKIFKERLPYKPYCTNNLEYGVQIRDKEKALEKLYIQYNPPGKVSVIILDVDYPIDLETTFKEKNLPMPNVIVWNKKNYHAHLFFFIKDPVCTTDNARKKPLVVLSLIEYALRELFQSDEAYSGFIAKNLDNDHWLAVETNKELFDFELFLEYLTLPQKLPKKASVVGLGRNCTLFEVGRKYAYKQVLVHRCTTNKDSFYNDVFSYIDSYNKNFPEPLFYNEVKTLSKSISNWTWKNYKTGMNKEQWDDYVKNTHTSELQAIRGACNSKEQQSIKGKKSGEIRRKGSAELLQPWIELGISRAWYYKQKKLGLI